VSDRVIQPARFACGSEFCDNFEYWHCDLCAYDAAMASVMDGEVPGLSPGEWHGCAIIFRMAALGKPDPHVLADVTAPPWGLRCTEFIPRRDIQDIIAERGRRAGYTWPPTKLIPPRVVVRLEKVQEGGGEVLHIVAGPWPTVAVRCQQLLWGFECDGGLRALLEEAQATGEPSRWRGESPRLRQYVEIEARVIANSVSG